MSAAAVSQTAAALAARHYCVCGVPLCGGCGECHQRRCADYIPAGVFDMCSAKRTTLESESDL